MKFRILKFWNLQKIVANARRPLRGPPRDSKNYTSVGFWSVWESIEKEKAHHFKKNASFQKNGNKIRIYIPPLTPDQPPFKGGYLCNRVWHLKHSFICRSPGWSKGNCPSAGPASSKWVSRCSLRCRVQNLEKRKASDNIRKIKACGEQQKRKENLGF